MKNSVFILLFLALCSFLEAQEIVTSSGDYLGGESGSVTFTLGECVTETFTAGSLTLTQGFQQTELTATTIGELQGLDFTISASPNPVTEFIEVNINRNQLDGLQIHVMNMTGRELMTLPVQTGVTAISFGSLPASTYLLTVTEKNRILKTIKIIKK